MKCQNCEAEAPAEAERCENCGAKLLVRRVILGAPRNREFTLTAEAEPESAETESGEMGQSIASEDWQFPGRIEALAPTANPAAVLPETPYGGFSRRLVALLIDFVVVLLLSAVMGVMAFIAYKVGLAAHGRLVSWDTAVPLMVFLTGGMMLLGTAYFVVFHGMEGKTVGKWLLGLRVVGTAQQPISYRRALLRWFAAVGLGCVSIGLSFLWILWSGEKRAWHDVLARTWVIRE